MIVLFIIYLIDILRVAVSAQDPEIPASYRLQQAKGKQRKVLQLDSNKQKRKRPMTDDARVTMKQLEDEICQPSSAAVEENGPPKKKRRGVDMKIAQECHNPQVGRSSRSKSLRGGT